MESEQSVSSSVKEATDERKALTDRRASVRRAYLYIVILVAILVTNQLTLLYSLRQQKNTFASLLESQATELRKGMWTELGLIPPQKLRALSESIVPIESEGNFSANFGSASYLGHGYFLTVKHVVAVLGSEGLNGQRKINSVWFVYRGRRVAVEITDTGNAVAQVTAGDWAVVRSMEPIELLALPISLEPLEYGQPFYRIGDDFSKGLIPGTGLIGPKIDGEMYGSLSDAHPGVSGGAIFNKYGYLIGIPVGRMIDGHRYSFILPLRREMFRKVPHLRN